MPSAMWTVACGLGPPELDKNGTNTVSSRLKTGTDGNGRETAHIVFVSFLNFSRTKRKRTGKNGFRDGTGRDFPVPFSPLVLRLQYQHTVLRATGRS